MASSTTSDAEIPRQPPPALRVAGGAPPSASPSLLDDVPHRLRRAGSHLVARRLQRHYRFLRYRPLLMKIDLVRNILDSQLVDREGTKMGRVDGVVIELRDGEPPAIHHLQLGGIVLARRVGRRAERFVEWFRRHVRVREEAVQEIGWERVGEITQLHVKVSLDAFDTPAFAWEKWLRERVVGKMPESSK